jgi:U3 small nucleolar ribonucleoprotein component
MTCEARTWHEIVEDGWRITKRKFQIDVFDDQQLDKEQEQEAAHAYQTDDEDEIAYFMELPPNQDQQLELLRTYDLNPLL